MKLHVLGMPFSDTTREWSWCAYTARTLTFCTMMYDAGYEVILYGGERNEAEVSEFVPLVTSAERREWWPNYIPERDVFNDFNPGGEGWQAFTRRAIAEIGPRADPGDILCLTMGWSQKLIADGLADLELFPVETGIGYSGVWAPYRVFESWAWRAFLQAKEPTDDVRLYDEVIARAYEVSDFPAGGGEGGYALFVGRLMARKGPHIAAMAAQRAGVPLVVAGQGIAKEEPGRLTCTDGTVLEGDVSYAGVLGPEERAKVMGEAMCILTPTMYFEPFGGVSVEAQLCGTPAIVSPSGGLVENVEDSKTGFICSMLADFAMAITVSPMLKREGIRRHAQMMWGTEPIAARFDAYFRRLATLQGPGWYA